MGWLKKYMPHYLRRAVPAWVCLLGEVLVDLSLPTLMATIVNVGILGNDSAFTLRIGALMLGIALSGAVLGNFRNILSTRASQDLGTELRADLFRKTQAMSLEGVRRFGAATLITRITNDVMQIQNLSFLLTRIFLRAPLLLVGGIIMAFTLNAGMALVLVGALPLLAVLLTLRILRGMPLFQKVQTAVDRVNGVMREYLAGIRVVKVFHRTEYEGARFDKANRDLTGIGVKAARSMATIQPLILLVMNGSILLLLWMGGVRVDSGGAKVGDVMAFVTYFQQILQAMTMMSMIFTAGARARTSLTRIGLVFASTDVMPDPARPGVPPRAGALEMRDVSFVYDGQSSPVLTGIDFAVAAGETAAVIGSTGSGKSTLVHLVQRFHDVTSGGVLVDGQDVRDFAQKELRCRVAIVPQQSVLFTGTLRENLLWGDEDATEADLFRALAVAQASDFVARMPEGLDTRIGQGGVNLSGGQKQRLCIARALIRKPDVLIMDDSTSAVDMETERRLRGALREECAGMTVLVVAQRIHTVMEADTILVLDEGRLVQQGTHAELLRNCAIYRDIYRSQVGLDVAGREVV